MLILRQKTFNTDLPPKKEKKTGIGLGTKLALGAGAVAGTFYGAKKGFLGNNAMLTANKAWARVGNSLGSQSMMNSGVAGIQEGIQNKLAKKTSDSILSIAKDKGFNVTKDQINQVKARSLDLNKGNSIEYATRWANKNLNKFNQ